MRPYLATLPAVAALFLALSALPTTALAVLKPGDTAPDFTTQASMGGQVTSFSLDATLKKGPVVLYFFPAAFTSGCTIEAHLFADAIDRYKELGATVIGVSNDDIDTLNRFSLSECRSKFAVAADTDKKIIKAYDAAMLLMPSHASRVSYVITPDHKVIYEYSSLNPDQHVANTMKALEQWKAKTR
ncbi:peroxiredoxin [Herbaspirillum sp. RTI4]|uniref:peroxiredoxin n=1 Tax=Herbaspirillum sp. RTI4 TaxID=3048640 RepID=UPI002AB3BFA8|nr:peroxiredoxin [Herbaspirillum sp. RTI4]MDY7577520.1 peroxiredoxin [Herbaspirillum sp. RTI4]MEA9980995.1 peroxiredoxin [Herbaspirillum sp. RTI4]